MKIVFAALVFVFSVDLYARTLGVFTVSTQTTVEDNAEAMLDAHAISFCGGASAQRVSSIQTNYRPYQYNIRVWANYVCDL